MLVYIIQEKCLEKKLTGFLFMDIKEAFDYILKSPLLNYIIDLSINRNLIG